jgi:hypothetical protein
MRTRRRSVFSRALDALPVFGVLALGGVGVFVAMNVLVSAAPLALNLNSGSPSGSVAPSLRGSPTALPFATDTPFSTAAPSASVPDFRPTIVTSAASATDPNGVWRVYLAYPAFVPGTTPWADVINADIGGEIQTRAAQWQQGPAANPQVARKVNTLSGTFKTELLTSALSSFTLTWVDDSSASQPAASVETINLDMSTGQRIAFDDLFADPDAALAVMSGAAQDQLVEELGLAYDRATVTDGTSPSRTNFINWALTAAGIKITFAQHQVATGFSGLPSVMVPWASLRSTMVQTGPVAKLAGL